MVLIFVMDGESHKSWKFGRNLIHRVLSDASILDTCYVSDDLLRGVTCFVMNADTLTMLCRE